MRAARTPSNGTVYAKVSANDCSQHYALTLLTTEYIVLLQPQRVVAKPQGCRGPQG